MMLSGKQLSKRIVRISVFAVIIVATVALSLVLVTGTSDAAGPGKGRGNGNRNGGVGQRGYGQGRGIAAFDQTRAQLRDGDCDGTGDCIPDRLQLGGGGNGYGWQGANGQRQMGGLLLNLPPATPGELPDDVVAALQAGIQDEYHARETYQAVIAQLGAVRPFTNIVNAEQTHINALAFMFERYGLEVPEGATAQVTAQFGTVQEACAAAAAAEIANFELYDEWLATVQDYPDIVQVFQALRDASEFQHLPAFEYCAG